MKFLSDDSGESYNRCHFWSNFEIANLNLWRSPAYKAFFDYLDQAGGFYYEVSGVPQRENELTLAFSAGGMHRCTL